MPERDLALLEDVARAAGALALRYWKQNPEAWDKDDGAGPVSEADLAVNRLMETALREARPDYGWLSEESPDDIEARLGDGPVFVVDPIDGTRAFLAGETSFAHSIAVVRGGAVVAGVVFAPAKGRLYAAAAGGPALCNGQPIHADVTHAAPEVLANAATMAPAHWPGGVPALRRAFRSSIAYRLCLVAEGRFGAMLTLRETWEWDVAAGALIAECAGARIGDGRGQALRFNRAEPRLPGVMAAAPALWDDILARRLGR